ncbi:hypothetical protein KXD40_006581 [Peronospora effusa]|uniref:Tubulin--tyrosine ligase-like protein 12 SET-like domain-containing protein n=1 Tax=Peronospora effusa TaxID=542832 RepID=A0A3M6VPM2_9STRA|nr:hypothetical protein DD238_002880 [Peronospora effusa]RQM09876.1 hypothetical protein DD237_002093 [Peronospora effusa]UIZ24926.1 hypothetical protein KXD40_006581 [Peronospora effusa]CAI5719844.1 unnamed protein product [Peronospora effusa]
MEHEMETFLKLHQAQLVAAQVPQLLWPVVYYKLKHEIFDAGNYFYLAQDEDKDLHVVVRDDVDLNPVQPEGEDALFLMDHAWTFTLEKVYDQLNHLPTLLERMETLMQLEMEETRDLAMEKRVETVANCVWRYANTYRFGNVKPEEASTIWYVMDEVGSAIEHADEPNVRMAPFYYGKSQCAFSLVWTVQPIEAGDFLSRDYFPDFAADDAMHTALLAALFYKSGKADSLYVEELQEIVRERKQAYTLESARAKFRAIVSRDAETFPDPETTVTSTPLSTVVSGSESLRVCSDLKLVHDNLTHSRFTLVGSEDDAQVVWLTHHLKEFPKYTTNDNVYIINQFPNEKVLTCKDLLYEMCKLHNGGERPDWLAETYNMNSEFPELIAQFIRRDLIAHKNGDGDDDANHWICKPWNMARSIDTCIAQNAPHLARLAETGPKVACKYIHRPLLIDQRKFDFRFLVMVKSTEPLELYLSGVYWLRIANKEFAMDNFEDFEKHFTVMNYSDFAVRIMDNVEFVDRFDNEYPSEDWSVVYADICSSIKQLFEFATAQPPPLGLGRCTKSRALYGVDVMLSWEADEETGDEQLRPVILETNYQPDCTRACKYYPHFYNDVMNVLVLDRPDDTVHGCTRL